MKKVLLFSIAILITTSVFAFGGGGKSRQTYHGKGVTSVGVHISSDSSPCPKNQELLDDVCVDKCPEGVTRSTRDGSCSICVNKNVYLPYKEDPCSTETPEDMGCRSNDDCPAGEFCKLEGVWSGMVNCSLVTGGECAPIGNFVGPVDVPDFGSVVVSNTSMTWWAADNWCKAQGKTLIDVKLLECYKNGTELITTDVTGNPQSICCREGQDCGSWGGYWSGSTLKEETAELARSLYSPIAIALRQALYSKLNVSQWELWLGFGLGSRGCTGIRWAMPGGSLVPPILSYEEEALCVGR